MMLDKNPIKTPLTPLKSRLFTQKQVNVWIKRDDLNHPVIQGNKWHKLKLNLLHTIEQNKKHILTFGGAYSNHIAATSAAAQELGLLSTGIIRGNELQNNPENWSQTLQIAHKNGMHLEFINRSLYRQKNNQTFLHNLQQQYPDAYLLPEGGTNELAIMGFQDLVKDINQQCPNWTHLYSPVGTGGTLSGLIHFVQNNLSQSNTHNRKNIIGIPVLKQGEYLATEIQDWLTKLSPKYQKEAPANPKLFWKLLTQYHDGGYAKQSLTGLQFHQNFEQEFNILLDPVYTAKMVYAFYDQLQTNQIPKGSNIILLHTGGLQGRQKPNL